MAKASGSTCAFQMERDLISERTADVLAHKKEKGEWLGKAPVGYRYNMKSKRLEEDQEEMRLIRKAKRLRRSGLSIGVIAKRLNMGKTTVYRLINSNLKSYKARYVKALT